MLSKENQEFMQELLQAIEVLMDQKLDERFGAYDEKMDERFAAYDRKMDERFAANNRYILSEVDARILKSESMLLDEMERIHNQVINIAQKQKQMQADINALKSRDNDTGIIYAYLNKLDSRVSRLESAISPT